MIAEFFQLLNSADRIIDNNCKVILGIFLTQYFELPTARTSHTTQASIDKQYILIAVFIPSKFVPISINDIDREEFHACFNLLCCDMRFDCFSTI